MAASKKRKRSPHAGVVLLKPSGTRTSWRARYTDPDSGKLKFERLDSLSLRTAEARRDWAIRKAKANARRELELKDGATRKTQTPLADGFTAFFEARKSLEASTLEGYRKRTDAFTTWGQDTGVTTLDDINRTRLLEYRDSVINAPSARGAATRSEHYVNRVLRETSVPLHWLLERRMLPACDGDDLKIGLKRLRTRVDRIDFLGRGQPAELLQAALAHDRATKEGYTTLRTLVSPFILTLLLGGMRFSEALDLKWNQVDLKARGHDGQVTGELYLFAENVKTKRGREVSFDVSSALLALMTALKEHAPGDRVFWQLNRPTLEAARKRLKAQGAPSFSYQSLRRTCGSYLTNSPGIFGAAAAFHSAKRLGHSVAVAEKHYLGTVKGIPHEAKTLEQAMGIEAEAAQVIKLVKERYASQVAAE